MSEMRPKLGPKRADIDQVHLSPNATLIRQTTHQFLQTVLCLNNFRKLIDMSKMPHASVCMITQEPARLGKCFVLLLHYW